jgi:hypothetical protein
MPHAALDIRFHSNPKILSAGNAAIGLFARALSYRADHLTDGLVPGQWVAVNGKPAEAKRLVDAGLWEREGNGYRIRDYLKHNLSKAKVEEKSARGRELADARWGKRDAMRSALQNTAQNAVQDAMGDSMPLTLTDSLTHTEPGFESSIEENSALDVAGLDEGKLPLAREFLNEIRDRTPSTAQFLLPLMRIAPEAALVHTIETLRKRRTAKPRLESESKYARHVLADYLQTNGRTVRTEAT